MNTLMWNERVFTQATRFTEVSGPSVCTESTLRLFGNREINLVNRCRHRICASFSRFIAVFQVGIGSGLKGLHSLVRVATFNRDKNLIRRIWSRFDVVTGGRRLIVTNISQAIWIGLLRQGWVVKQKTRSRIFPNTHEVASVVRCNVHGFSHVRGICVSTEHTHTPCVLR